MGHIHEKIDWTVNGLIVHNNKFLMVLHKKLEMWLPPGGHIELDDSQYVIKANIRAYARRALEICAS